MSGDKRRVNELLCNHRFLLMQAIRAILSSACYLFPWPSKDFGSATTHGCLTGG